MKLNCEKSGVKRENTHVCDIYRCVIKSDTNYLSQVLRRVCCEYMP